ncbi:hypothetical protein C8N35_1011494 [Breoghania corrubedonensis]|uniref:Uncharacterized protein n=1 Tax=Breoghania corrubedonensis TaxID=665038 RepID=A0A2T5VI53_9HYPH|nr:hypothetical protein [Breoghania corrubedonensis]PTW63441.1 hypothetical protein C8N35_1011494 [Breoghania corrubedonensis]
MIPVSAILTLKIETEEPIELDAFVGAFTSIAEEYRRSIREYHPDIEGDSRIYVKEIRKGSYEADLIPLVAAAAAPLVSSMDQLLIAEQFVRTWGARIKALASGKFDGWEPTKGELATLANATKAIATDPNASSTLSAVRYRDGRRDVEASFVFSTPDAVRAQASIDAAYRALEATDHSEYRRVLMVFTRSDIGSARVGRRSADRVKIEELSPKPLAVMYASDLAKDRIKHEIRESDDNIYKKGFVVDVNVRTLNGKPSVYAVTNVHEIIELPDDDE